MVAGGGGDVHLFDDVVAQADGLFDGLEPDGEVGEARNGQRAGDRTGRQDQFVVRQLLGTRALLAGGEGGQGGGALGVVDGGDLADDDPAVRQDAAQRYDDVPRGDGARGGLWQERLVRHVRVGCDHRDLGFAPAQFLFQLPLEPQGRVHPDVATADNENARTFLHHPMTHPAPEFVHSPDNLCDRGPGGAGAAETAGVDGRRAGQRVCAGVREGA